MSWKTSISDEAANTTTSPAGRAAAASAGVAGGLVGEAADEGAQPLTSNNAASGIWLLTPKRGQPGYLDQRDLILAGPTAGVVDNKTCSVSDTTSGIRFVIRKIDRVYC